MQSKRQDFRVFISSTSEDLRDYRGVARNVILKMGWHPEMMEYFGAGPTPTVAACRDKIKDCDAVLLLVAFRQGWVPDPKQGGNGNDSITALEIAYAHEMGIPVLAMMADENWPTRLTEEDNIMRKWVRQFRDGLNLPAEFFNYEEPAGPEAERLPAFRVKVSEVLIAHRERILAETNRPTGTSEGVDYFDSAFDTIREGRGIPFLGAGIYGDGPLGTQALINALRKEGTWDELPCLATAAEYRQRYLKRRDKLLRRLHQIIDDQSTKAESPAVFDMIAEAPVPPLIVSATYDQLLERHLDQIGKSYVVVTHIVRSHDAEHDGKILLFPKGQEATICLADRLDLSGADLVIYRPLGSPLLNHRLDSDAEIDTVVITECDHLTFLGRLQHQHTQIPTRFSRLFQRRTLLFIGYGLDVWHFRLVMRVFQSIGGRGKDALTLAVRQAASKMESLAWQRLGADLITLDPNEFAQKVRSEMALEYADG